MSDKHGRRGTGTDAGSQTKLKASGREEPAAFSESEIEQEIEELKKLNPMQIGILIGRALRRLLSFTETQGMVVVHRIRGRRRYICKALRGRKDVCADLERRLKNFPGITSARVNPITASITVTYMQDEQEIDRLFDSLSHALAGRHAVQEETLLPTEVVTAGDTLTDYMRKIRDRIKRFFNHTEPLFLSRILGIVLFVYGLSRIIKNGDRPAGPQLFWWGLGLLLRQSHIDVKNVLSN